MNRKLLLILTFAAFVLGDAIVSLAHAKASAPICLTGVKWPKCSRPGSN